MSAQAPDSPDIASQNPLGATITTAYTGRIVKVIALLNSELETISSLNTQATIYISVASSLIALAAGVWVTAGFTPISALPPAGILLMNIGAPVLVFLGIVFVALACLAFRSKRSLLSNLRMEQASQPRLPASSEL